ncbi:MAG: hypothetical protein CL933_24600 [Deltaproteobacteria bacterium]|nr:hypothetical protein [Deltaproteobacteria bacterium]
MGEGILLERHFRHEGEERAIAEPEIVLEFLQVALLLRVFPAGDGLGSLLQREGWAARMVLVGVAEDQMGDRSTGDGSSEEAPLFGGLKRKAGVEDDMPVGRGDELRIRDSGCLVDVLCELADLDRDLNEVVRMAGSSVLRVRAAGRDDVNREFTGEFRGVELYRVARFAQDREIELACQENE